MAVEAFAHYGVILRRNARTRRLARGLVFRPLRNVDRHAPPWMHDDDHLVARIGGFFLEQLERRLAEWAQLGLVRGRDYVVTTGTNTLADPMPAWLTAELGPTGNPPELEAKMDPEVREMWQRTRKVRYSIAPGFEEDHDA